MRAPCKACSRLADLDDVKSWDPEVSCGCLYVGHKTCRYVLKFARDKSTFTFHFHALEKEMATHSSILTWRIPGMGETDGLPSMGSHRVGHD